MMTLKTYLIIVALLLFGALGFGIYVWYMYQSLNTQMMSEKETDTGHESSTGITSKQVSTTTARTSATTTPQKPITIDTAKLSSSQQDILKAFGYTGSVTFSTEMIRCAKNAVGETRFNAIIGGSAPSPLESLKLLPCFKK